jgi:hypothetical protein
MRIGENGDNQSVDHSPLNLPEIKRAKTIRPSVQGRRTHSRDRTIEPDAVAVGASMDRTPGARHLAVSRRANPRPQRGIPMARWFKYRESGSYGCIPPGRRAAPVMGR